ncbi:MAG: 50S ribosomal protein L9 [Alphaproteobacteria bacterium]|nr:50S ribosomal protein L9 [Alphaproteobacteria bacterium]
MQVILLERVEKLGQMGDVVKVKGGFARNYLLPRKKALRATKANMAHFESQKAQLEARNLHLKKEADAIAAKLDKNAFVILRQAGETGILYGSVSTRDIADAITGDGVTVARNQIALDKAIKTLGMHEVKVVLHPEVRVGVTMNIARTADEAERQARGENILLANAEAEAQAEALANAEAVFEKTETAEEPEAAETKAEAKPAKSAKGKTKEEKAAPDEAPAEKGRKAKKQES